MIILIIHTLLIMTYAWWITLDLFSFCFVPDLHPFQVSAELVVILTLTYRFSLSLLKLLSLSRWCCTCLPFCHCHRNSSVIKCSFNLLNLLSLSLSNLFTLSLIELVYHFVWLTLFLWVWGTSLPLFVLITPFHFSA